MAASAKDLIAIIEGFAPPAIQEAWDNCGWQIDPGRATVRRVLVALEITNAVIEEAQREDADLILIHHPLLFVPVRRIDFSEIVGGYIAKLISAGIGVYAAHTSFDSAPGGMNDSLAALLGLTCVVPFPPENDAPPEDGLQSGGTPMARRGAFETPRTFAAVCRQTERLLGMESRLRVVGDPDALVKTVALCGGAGGGLVPDVLRHGCDLYITSDVKHHEAQWAKEGGLCLIDGGHFGTEQHFVATAAQNIRRALKDRVDVVETSVSADPFGNYSSSPSSK